MIQPNYVFSVSKDILVVQMLAISKNSDLCIKNGLCSTYKKHIGYTTDVCLSFILNISHFVFFFSKLPLFTIFTRFILVTGNMRVFATNRLRFLIDPIYLVY